MKYKLYSLFPKYKNSSQSSGFKRLIPKIGWLMRFHATFTLFLDKKTKGKKGKIV